MKIIHINKERMQIPKSDRRILKVVQKPQGKSYVSGFNLQGKYLQNYGFNCGDLVTVEFKMNKIIISKDGDLRA